MRRSSWPRAAAPSTVLSHASASCSANEDAYDTDGHPASLASLDAHDVPGDTAPSPHMDEGRVASHGEGEAETPAGVIVQDGAHPGERVEVAVPFTHSAPLVSA